ncbi:MAG TPA: purine-nucleoside phosphorylase [Verrucomicrobiae bacterium]
MSKVSPLTTAARLRKYTRLRPTLAVVLGSGFNHVLAAVEAETSIPYSKLPGFPPVAVHGHAGQLVFAQVDETPVALLCGRAHFYEGHPMEVVTFAVRALAEFGVKSLLLTNAAGGMNPKFRAGDFMRLTDHLNLMGTNPLRGAPVPGRERFVDLSQVYDPALGRMLETAARRAGTRVQRGVYVGLSGPSYETPAEIRAFRKLGGDAVGMSTVPEVLAANHMGVRVAGVSCITHQAAGPGGKPLTHEEVAETAHRVKDLFTRLLEDFLPTVARAGANKA